MIDFIAYLGALAMIGFGVYTDLNGGSGEAIFTIAICFMIFRVLNKLEQLK